MASKVIVLVSEMTKNRGKIKKNDKKELHFVDIALIV